VNALARYHRQVTEFAAAEVELPRDLAVPCCCGGAVPLLLFVRDGLPHNNADCPHCGRPCFLLGTPPVPRR
jgi:hypothetical protein